MTVGKIDNQPEKVLTTETFRKIEVEMELGRNSILKLKYNWIPSSIDLP